MSSYRAGLATLTMTVLCCGAPAQRAEGFGSGTVTGHGSVELKRQPQFLRVQVDVLARGKDITEALAKLRQRRQAAQKHLEQLGVAANAVEFGKPAIVTERNNQQRQMFMMRQMQLQMQGKKAAKPKEPPPVIVSCSLKADVRLTAPDTEELLITAHTLEERIKLADIGGTKELKAASPQDEEMEQEEAMAMMNYGDPDAPKRGEPIFVYVSKVSEDEQQKARAEAFQKARREATQLAKAAGVDLGPLAHLDDNSANAYNEDGFNFDGNYAYRVQQILGYTRSSLGGADSRTGEAVGLQPGKVSYRIALSASFELRQPAGK
jgi:hypothetical protein